MSKSLTICKCPQHGYYAISIDDADGCGTRITPSKCCGRWDVVKSFPMTASQLRAAAEELEIAAAEME